MADDETTTGPALPREASADEIRELMEDILADRVVTILDPPEFILPMVFMPLALGALAGWPDELRRKVVPFGVIGKHRTVDRSVNGYPIFMEMALWRLDDFMRAAALAIEASRASRAIMDAALGQPRPDDEGR